MPELGVLEALWGWPPPVLDPAGPYADSVTLLAWVLFGMGFAVTAIVVAALWLALRGPEKWRRRLGGERAIWIGGIAFPGVVLTALLIWGLTLTASLTRDLSGDEMRVRVTGHMWWFEVEYLGADGEVVLRDANELHLPVGRPVVLELRSADVIHSFWVPNLSGKKDMIPGRVTTLPVQADRAGRFGGVCAEYCGGPHALMGFVAVAHDAASWREWLAGRRPAAQRVASQDVPGALPALTPGRAEMIPNYAERLPEYDPRSGWRLFLDSGCAACHRIAGTEANGLAGPDLTHVGSRLSLGAGILPNNRGTLIGWIGDSQSIKPGNRMPSYDMLSAEELGHIAAFLEAQKVSSETGFDHALYERFPTQGPRPAGELEELKRVWAAPRGWGLLTVVNNNYIGFFYVAASFLFFLLAGILALGMRVQLAAPLQEFLPQETYNQFFTMHGTVMMFLFAVPAVEALGVMLLPQMLAARDLPFPRLSAYAFWAYLVGGLCFFASLFVGLAPDGGWFMYPPLTSIAYSPGINTDFWLLGIGFIEISAIAGAIEIIVGVLRTRAPGMTLDRMPIFAWAMLVFAVMIVIAFPSVILGTLLLELERAFNWPFFDPTRGGDPLLWQHLFWFFGHPEVYIIFLPAAGLTSMMVATVARTPLVGYRLNVVALVATGFISFGVWAHHMFATGMPRMTTGYFSAASMAVSLPAGIQVFCWIATLASGKIRWSTPALFVIGSIVTFTMGGLTGVMVAMVPFDWQAHDTYFIVAHLHYVLIGGMVMPMFATFYYWAGMTSRNGFSERLGKWVFALFFTGVHVTFLPMHLTGLMGMPRRVYTYLPGRSWDLLNLTSTIGAFIIAAGIALFLFDIARRFRFTTDHDAGNLYGGGTLEWLPTGLYSTRSIPVVRSREPLWDDPQICDDVEEGRYFLPGSATGLRETIITSPVNAEPQYLQLMPGPSPWPVGAAVFTAFFFLSLTVQAYAFGVFSGIIAAGCVLRWLWETDRPIDQTHADVGGGIVLPIAITGPSSHGWWALNTLMVVMGMIAFMGLFSYLYLFGIHPEVWIAPPPLLQTGAIAGLLALALGAAWLSRRWLAARAAGTFPGQGPWLSALAGAILLGAAFYWDITGWRAAGLAPDATGQGATVFALIAYQGCCVAIAGIMALYLGYRSGRGLLVGPTSVTLDVVARFIGYVALQGLATGLVVRLFPGG